MSSNPVSRLLRSSPEASPDGITPVRCFRVFRRHGRSGLQADLPGAQAMVRRGSRGADHRGGQARAGHRATRGARARSLEEHSTLDEAAFEKLCLLLRYVDGDYRDTPPSQSFARRWVTEHPLHYLAIPPSMFRRWWRAGCGPAGPGCAGGASRSLLAVIWPPRSSSTRPSTASSTRHDLPHRSLPRQGAGPEPALLPLRQRLPRADLEPQLRRERPDHHGRDLRRAGPRRFYEETGAIRDVVQNHLMQVIGLLAMEPPRPRLRRCPAR